MPPDLRFDRRVATGCVVDAAAEGCAGRLRVLTGLDRAAEVGAGEATGDRNAIGSGDSGEPGSDLASTAVTIALGTAEGGSGVLTATGRGVGFAMAFLGDGTGAGFVSLTGAAGVGRATATGVGAGAASDLTVGRAETVT